ncbi:MAG: hypothetical protein BWY26_01637 [Elusimicrobia bacterium ADurb.Bin231]|nr:MAG: hypothetical protein BWY26_01637 [Elusimicrobia bacterium ADurb.Bin231]
MKKNQSGSAITILMMMFIVISIISFTGYQLITTAYKDVKYQQNWVLQAGNAARAGLVDAISWFRRQPNQPVKSGIPPITYSWVDGAFDPHFSTDPVHSDTIDQSIGIVKEYQLSEDNLIWCRYEVKRQSDTAIFAYDPESVHDISGERLHTGDPEEGNGSGIVWYISSTGYIFRKRSALSPFDISPNEIVAKTRCSTEIRRIKLQPPGQCAYIVDNGGTSSNRKVRIYANGRISGSGYVGCGRRSGSAPRIETGASVTGNPATITGLNSPTVEYVFGVTSEELKTLSDYAVDTTATLPLSLPDMSLIYVNGDAVFDSSKPLKASGILFVNGDLTISNGSNSYYSGLIYVTGKAYIYPPCLISGCIIAFNGLTLSQTGATDIAEINYDVGILNSVKQQICQYRENKSLYRIYSGIPGM